MDSRLVPKSVTLNDLERRTLDIILRYLAEAFVANYIKVVD